MFSNLSSSNSIVVFHMGIFTATLPIRKFFSPLPVTISRLGRRESMNRGKSFPQWYEAQKTLQGAKKIPPDLSQAGRDQRVEALLFAL